MNQAEEHIVNKLAQRKSEHLFRKLQLESFDVDFLSNDYLGLGKLAVESNHFPLSAGSGGSRLLSGNSKDAENLEQYLSQEFSCEAALVFNSGYTANLSLFSCIPGRNDTVLFDDKIHASIRDGIRMSHCKSIAFKHNDCADLVKKARFAKGLVYVAVESVYSMDGDEAPLEAIHQICAENSWHLIVDEAHALGVLGIQGKGLSFNLKDRNALFARILTFGKAAAYHGAAILGSLQLKEYLINFARPFIYSTALPPHDYKIIKQHVERMINAHLEREKLHELIAFWNANAPDNLCSRNKSAIQILRCSGNENVDRMAKLLQADGLGLRPVKSPTVKAGEERIRIILHSFNTVGDIERLFLKLNEYPDKNYF
jgi:8-amino-7-oxononanoate synthase